MKVIENDHKGHVNYNVNVIYDSFAVPITYLMSRDNETLEVDI